MRGFLYMIIKTRRPSLFAQWKCRVCKFLLAFWTMPQNLCWMFSCIWRTLNIEAVGTTIRSGDLNDNTAWIGLIWLLFCILKAKMNMLPLALWKLKWMAQCRKGQIKKLIGRKTDNNINLIYICSHNSGTYYQLIQKSHSRQNSSKDNQLKRISSKIRLKWTTERAKRFDLRQNCPPLGF